LAMKSEDVELVVRAISFQDRQTDRQTTCNSNTTLCTKVHRAVKTAKQSVKHLPCILHPIPSAPFVYDLLQSTTTAKFSNS